MKQLTPYMLKEIPYEILLAQSVAYDIYKLLLSKHLPRVTGECLRHLFKTTPIYELILLESRLCVDAVMSGVEAYVAQGENYLEQDSGMLKRINLKVPVSRLDEVLGDKCYASEAGLHDLKSEFVFISIYEGGRWIE